jgi:hypothetical protein
MDFGARDIQSLSDQRFRFPINVTESFLQLAEDGAHCSRQPSPFINDALRNETVPRQCFIHGYFLHQALALLIGWPT